MLRQLHDVAIPAVALSGYVYVLIELRDHIVDVPIIYPALLVLVLAQYVRRTYPVLHSTTQWLTFAIYVFQLTSIHANNLCLRQSCDTDDPKKYVALASTGILILQTKHKAYKDNKAETKQTKKTSDNTNVATIQNIKLKFEPNSTSVKWV